MQSSTRLFKTQRERTPRGTNTEQLQENTQAVIFLRLSARAIVATPAAPHSASSPQQRGCQAGLGVVAPLPTAMALPCPLPVPPGSSGDQILVEHCLFFILLLFLFLTLSLYTITARIYFHPRYFLLKLRTLCKSLRPFHGRVGSAVCGERRCNFPLLVFPWGRGTKHHHHHLHGSGVLRSWHPKFRLSGMQHPKGWAGGSQNRADESPSF